MMLKTLQPSLLTAALLPAFPQAQAQLQTFDEPAAQKVVVVGSRGAARSALDTAVRLGLLDAKDPASPGTLELGKALQELDPSFNFSTTFISDGTDIIRPATLRGLGPDQLPVLINGKRRHRQALVFNERNSINVSYWYEPTSVYAPAPRPVPRRRQCSRSFIARYRPI